MSSRGGEGRWSLPVSDGPMEDLIIVGAGGTSRDIAWAVEDINESARRWNLLGFLDDDPAKAGMLVNGYPVLGSLDSLESIVKSNSISEMIVTSGNISEGKLERLSQICNSHHICLRRFQTQLEEIPLNGQAV